MANKLYLGMTLNALHYMYSFKLSNNYCYLPVVAVVYSNRYLQLLGSGKLCLETGDEANLECILSCKNRSSSSPNELTKWRENRENLVPNVKPLIRNRMAFILVPRASVSFSHVLVCTIAVLSYVADMSSDVM